jgi:hypothetical protein
MADHPSEVTCHSINHISASVEGRSFFSLEIYSPFICMNILSGVHWGLYPAWKIFLLCRKKILEGFYRVYCFKLGLAK